MSDRIKAIEAMIQENPSDVFLHYSLGMEYAAARRYQDAVAKFRECIAIDQGYIPAYVEAGKSLRSLGQLQAAREVFSAGMELAHIQGQRHIGDYIQQQIDGLPKAD